jgi:superfamily II DNA helicase RecQ
LVYTTPEMLSKSEAVMKMLDKLHSYGRLVRFAIDEAHCVSHWGHDFRADYLELGKLRERY